mgnify:CR=1 FL=1
MAQLEFKENRFGIPPVTFNIIVINVIVFIATLVNENFMIGTFAMFYPASPYFRWWQPVTHMFMHGGFWHILFNMYSLFIFGTVVERAIGSRKFLLFYFLCGLGAAALHTGVQAIQAQVFINQIVNGVTSGAASYTALKMTPTLGASGAVYGVLLGYAMLYPDSKLTLLFPPVTLSAKWMVLIFLGIELITGVTGTADGVAHFAHLGGALIGWLLILIWRRRGTLFKRELWW